MLTRNLAMKEEVFANGALEGKNKVSLELSEKLVKAEENLVKATCVRQAPFQLHEDSGQLRL